MDLDKIAYRSKKRLLTRIPEDSPTRGDDDVLCPFCGYTRALTVRFSKLGRLRRVDGRRPYIEGVGMKCAGPGCAVRPDFDIPLVEGYWPELTAEEEWNREVELREGERAVDFGYDVPPGKSVERRLIELGYLEDTKHE